MKKQLLFLAVFLWGSGWLGAQNLFPNHSFENFANCPPSFYGSQPLDCFDWQRATTATPDYYTDAGSCTLPLFMGTASDGNGFIRVIAYHNLSAFGYANGVWAEKIKAELIDDISTGCTYELSVDLSLKPGPVQNLDKFDIGFYFYNGPLSFSGPGCLSATPQVTIPITGLTTTSWTTFNIPINFSTNFDSVVVGLFCNPNSYQGDYISGPNVKIDDMHLEAIDSTCCECDVVPDFSYCVDDCEVCFTNETSTSSCTQLNGLKWTFGDGNVSYSYNPCHTYTTAGSHEVCLTVSGTTGTEKCKAKHCTTIWIDEACDTCACEVESKFANTAVSINGCTYQYTAQSTVNECSQIIAYEWDFGDGTTATTQTASLWHTWPWGANTYNVCLTTVAVDGNDTCKSTACQSYSVRCGISQGGDDKKRVLSPGGIEIAEAPQTAAGEETWSMFPNPASDKVVIETLEGVSQFRIVVYDAQGRLVQDTNHQNESGPVSIDLNGWPAGSYQIILSTPEGAESMRTLVVQ